jgi:hypothetical protein
MMQTKLLHRKQIGLSKDLLLSRIMPRSSGDNAGGSFRSIEYVAVRSCCVANGGVLTSIAALPWLVKFFSHTLYTPVGTAIAEA